MQNEVRVGSVVLRGDVPSNSLSKTEHGRYILRHGDDGQIVKVPGPEEWGVDDRSWWPWYGLTRDRVIIVALGLTGQETAADLQRLAEVFEVRAFLTWGDQSKASQANRDEVHAIEHAAWPHLGDAEGSTHSEVKDIIAKLLHAAGWKPGMTAEDAARLLAEAGR